MKNTLLNQVLLLTFLILSASCETSFLDEKVTTSLSKDQLYKKTADYEMALMGVYDMLGARSLPIMDGGILNYLCNYNGGVPLLGELATDEMCSSAAGASKQLFLEELDKCKSTGQNTIVKSVYAGQYAMINQANALIFNAEKLSAPNAAIKQYVAEAKFLRALCYYNLVSLYGGVVCTTLPGSERVGTVLPRSSTEKVYEQIFQDLKDAYAVLPKSFAAEKEFGRATSIAAAALLARASLTAATMGKYAGITAELALEGGINSYEWARNMEKELFTQAKTYADKVIKEGFSSEDALLSMPYEQNFYPYENTVEVIFDVQFQYGFSQSEGGWVGRISGPGSWNWAIPTGNIANTYMPFGGKTIGENFPTPATKANCDMRKYKNITSFKYKGNGTLWPPLATDKTYNIGKYAVERVKDYPNQEHPHNFVVLRLAELYLIWAEADAELNNGPTADAYRMINYVRRRAANANVLPDLNRENLDDPTVVKPVLGITPQTELEKFRLALLQERMLEFVGEGIRKVDMIRSGWSAELLENVNVADYDKVKYLYMRRMFEKYSIFLPIPSREVTISNGIIIQNYGY